MKQGLYANIHAKRERIAKGSGEKMRRVGSEGAPTAKAFKQSARTAKMSEGGVANKPDPLPRRYGANFAYKVPREGQTDMRNIPVGNDPSAPNSQMPGAKAYMDSVRKRSPEMLKKMIKQDLGTHRKPTLPKKSGGNVKSCW
jgi:hypothetical protein